VIPEVLPREALERTRAVLQTPELTRVERRAAVLPLWASLVTALASGPIMDAGFPDRDWWPLTLVGIGLVLVALIGRTVPQALLVGFVAGLSFYLIHIEWASLFLGDLPMAALSVLESIFCAIGAAFIALAYRWIPRAWPSRVGRLGLLPVVIAAIWVTREFVTSTWPYGGFAWGRVALSQSAGPLAPLFAWVGITGVSFVMVWVVALVIDAFRMTDAPRLARASVAVGLATALVAVPAFPLVLSGSTTVAAVQGNGKAGYFDEREQGDLLAAQVEATRPLYGDKVDLVVWPEGASDIDPLRSKYAASVFDYVSEHMNAPLIAGTITERANGDTTEIFNTSLLWRAGEGAVDYYDKQHPIPFGEYVPNRAFWEPFAPDLIGLIGREYSQGTTDMVFDLGSVIVGLNICFDISDDRVMIDSVRQGAQLILAQTNNADFGHTDESVQQLAIARIRALELGRTVVNISTVGTSAIIAPDGSFIDRLPTYTADAMVATVPTSDTITPAVVIGGSLAWGIALFAIAALSIAGAAVRGGADVRSGASVRAGAAVRSGASRARTDAFRIDPRG
jgi:apolipoprotein N-acyltransferase